MRFPPERTGRDQSGANGGAGSNGRGLRFSSVLQGVGFAFAASLAASLVIGLIVAWTPTWDASDALLKALNVLAVVGGGLYAGRKSRRLGWLHGAGSGLVYILLVTWMISPDFSWSQLITAAWLRDALLASGAGALGGIVGVAT